MATQPGEMIIQSVMLNVSGNGYRLSLNGGWVNDEPDPVKFGKAVLQLANGDLFEDYSTDLAGFGTPIADSAELTYCGLFGNPFDGRREATLVAKVDDRANTYTYKLTEGILRDPNNKPIGPVPNSRVISETTSPVTETRQTRLNVVQQFAATAPVVPPQS
jgi:hypothetical protein